MQDVVLIGDKMTWSMAVVPEAIGLSYINTVRSWSWTSRLLRMQWGSKVKAVAWVTSEMANTCSILYVETEPTVWESRSRLSWLWRRNGLLFFLPSSFPPSFSLRCIPLYWIRTIACLLMIVDSSCMIMTHARILVLGPGGCTMTHGLIPWLTLLAYVCYRLCILNYKYLVVAVVGP